VQRGDRPRAAATLEVIGSSARACAGMCGVAASLVPSGCQPRQRPARRARATWTVGDKRRGKNTSRLALSSPRFTNSSYGRRGCVVSSVADAMHYLQSTARSQRAAGHKQFACTLVQNSIYYCWGLVLKC
jgi:hypothetical protein